MAGRCNGTADVHVAAQNGSLERGPHDMFERIELGAQMEVQIQAAMVDALQADDDVAMFGGLLDAGEAGHAADR